MSAFPETPATLLVKLAAQVTGEDEANWVRFADLYVPAIREFARHRGDGRDVDDVVQEVLSGRRGPRWPHRRKLQPASRYLCGASSRS